MMAHLFKQAHWDLDKDIATCLYSAIAFDTGQFGFSNVKSETMHVVSELMEHDIEHYKIIEKMTENKTPAYFQQIQNALNNMQYNEQFKYLYTTLPYVKSPGNDIINFIRQRKDTSFIGISSDNDIVKISLRSKNNFDVAKFAAQFNGGGHKKAAGIQLTGDMHNIQRTVIQSLENELIK